MRRRYILAIIVAVIVLVVAVVAFMGRTKYTKEAPAALWAASNDNPQCPSGYHTDVGGYCVLPEKQARAACSKLGRCSGYLVPPKDHSNLPGAWKNALYGEAQLTGYPPTANSAWSGVVYNKKYK